MTFQHGKECDPFRLPACANGALGWKGHSVRVVNVRSLWSLSYTLHEAGQGEVVLDPCRCNYQHLISLYETRK